jgi:hypothetical protein
MSEKSVEKYGADQVEAVERRKSTSEELTELSGIEATAASTAAWLISITVSIGGFLFGVFSKMHVEPDETNQPTQVTILATFPPCSLRLAPRWAMS